MASTTLSLPGIASQMCKAALEGIVTPIAGVRAVQVDVLTKTITIHHDHRASSRRLIEAIEEQGYHVAAPSVTNPQTSNHDSRWERCGAHAEDRGPVTITSASHALPEEHCVRLGFVDGDGI
ncbi:heavy-metal-associated domain-containing protein [Mycobacterium kubicae]|uniref:heavy-metal-associated domain-containing protein n=1 Tax=Mycobacterium kubicae TaxID=120959 RepID=UPI0009EE3728|nr:heavy-metal-associated domain-containing protein [Mycobacterium kubicae]